MVPSHPGFGPAQNSPSPLRLILENGSDRLCDVYGTLAFYTAEAPFSLSEPGVRSGRTMRSDRAEVIIPISQRRTQEVLGIKWVT